MSTRIVSDSTCLIALERIGNVEILPAIFETVLIPPAVEREVGISLPWLKVERLSDTSSVVALKLIIDDGEAEAIALAQEQQCRIITDDRRARSVARKFGLDVIGTIGVLVLAKKRDFVSSIEPLLIDLDVAGFYVSTALKEEALRLVDE